MLKISYSKGAQAAPGAPQMSPPYDSALIQMLSLLCLTFYIKKMMFFWLKGVILTTLRGHPEGSLGPLGAPGAPCAP